MASINKSADRIAFVGLGVMGGAMVVNLVEAGLTVTGYDIVDDRLTRLRRAGGRTASNSAEAAAEAELLIVMVVDAEQVEDVLFGPTGAVGALPGGATVMVSSTVSPDFARELGRRLRREGLELLDAPVSGGAVRAENGTLTIMASGPAAAIDACERALGAMGDKVYRLGDEPGTGSVVKMLNQLLAGVHVVAATEAMALGARAGIDPQLLFDIISSSAGSSWMFEHRVPHILEDDYSPEAALEHFVKDLGIVLDFGKRARFPLPLTASAHQMFLMGASAGLEGQDAAAVVKIFESITGVKVARAKAH